MWDNRGVPPPALSSHDNHEPAATCRDQRERQLAPTVQQEKSKDDLLGDWGAEIQNPVSPLLDIKSTKPSERPFSRPRLDNVSVPAPRHQIGSCAGSRYSRFSVPAAKSSRTRGYVERWFRRSFALCEAVENRGAPADVNRKRQEVHAPRPALRFRCSRFEFAALATCRHSTYPAALPHRACTDPTVRKSSLGTTRSYLPSYGKCPSHRVKAGLQTARKRSRAWSDTARAPKHVVE